MAEIIPSANHPQILQLGRGRGRKKEKERAPTEQALGEYLKW